MHHPCGADERRTLSKKGGPLQSEAGLVFSTVPPIKCHICISPPLPPPRPLLFDRHRLYRYHRPPPLFDRHRPYRPSPPPRPSPPQIGAARRAADGGPCTPGVGQQRACLCPSPRRPCGGLGRCRRGRLTVNARPPACPAVSIARAHTSHFLTHPRPSHPAVSIASTCAQHTLLISSRTLVLPPGCVYR